MKRFSVHSLVPLALALACASAGRADQVCDDFPERAGNWILRAPACGPSVSLDDGDEALRFTVPAGALIGSNYDNWTGADRAPTLERYDMGGGDWTISTRLTFVNPPGLNYHAGLMFAFGLGSEQNDVVYWGEYNDSLTLRVERTGSAQTPTIPYAGAPVELQVQKVGDDYTFRHRASDADPWTDDATVNISSSRPVARVGLMIKTWGAAPEVIADFDYFCLEVPDQNLPQELIDEPIPALTPITGLTCQKEGDSLNLGWTSCENAETDIIVRVNGERVETLPPDATGTTLDPPFPGGSILDIEIDNQSGFPPLRCTFAGTLFVRCDEFDQPTLDGDIWTFRVPSPGPLVSVTDNPDFLRFTTPQRAFDNWAGVDFAPTLERYDMTEGDWAIRTRLQWDETLGPPIGTHHVGLMFAFGLANQLNDVVYWGEYADSLTLGVERVGNNIRPVHPYDGAPVSLQIRKSGSTFIFSHRPTDDVPWTDDVSYTMTSSRPVSRVGLIIKSWGGGAAAVTADFDYFCLEVFDQPPVAAIEATPSSGMAPLEVQLSGAGSTDPSGGALTAYDWDFGDGQSGSGESVAHTYSDGGIVTTRLVVTDDEKNKGRAETRLFISDDVRPLDVARIGTSGLEGLVLRAGGDAENPKYEMLAGGSLIGARADHGHYLHRKRSGDFKVSVKVETGEFPLPLNSRCGLMARLGLELTSANVMMSLDELDDGLTFQSRAANGGNTVRERATADPPRASVLPFWIQLERQGPLFIGSYSRDGAEYLEYSRLEIPALDVAELFVGFAACSGAANQNARFVISELTGLGDPPPPAGPVFKRGDSNGDGGTNIADASYTLNFLFLGGNDPPCMAASDANGDGGTNIADASYALNFLFLGGRDPPAPFPDCGRVPEGSPEPDCASYPNCPQ